HGQSNLVRGEPVVEGKGVGRSHLVLVERDVYLEAALRDEVVGRLFHVRDGGRSERHGDNRHAWDRVTADHRDDDLGGSHGRSLYQGTIGLKDRRNRASTLLNPSLRPVVSRDRRPVDVEESGRPSVPREPASPSL